MKTKEYSMREMIIDQCLGTGREYTREELQTTVNGALESRGMLPTGSCIENSRKFSQNSQKKSLARG